MTAHDVLLSICIPTFNRSKLLESALRSVLREFPNESVEVLILDNASGDDTPEVAELFCRKSRHVRYIRNDANIGVERNALKAIEEARGEYVFVFSDDDVLLPGSGTAILTAIQDVQPVFLYLGHAGFWEGESPDAALARHPDPYGKTVVYTDGFALLYDALLEHNAAMVFNTGVARQALARIAEYQEVSFLAGYELSALAHQTVLGSVGPFARVCRCCVAVRNTEQISYNPIYSSHIDVVRRFQILHTWGLLNRFQLSKLMKKRVWGFRDNLILAFRCSKDPRYTALERRLIWRHDWRYWRFYLYLAPIVTLPRWIICPAYRIGQWFLRRHERSRGIERRVI